jgi:hypothetical protein
MSRAHYVRPPPPGSAAKEAGWPTAVADLRGEPGGVQGEERVMSDGRPEMSAAEAGAWVDAMASVFHEEVADLEGKAEQMSLGEFIAYIRRLLDDAEYLGELLAAVRVRLTWVRCWCCPRRTKARRRHERRAPPRAGRPEVSRERARRRALH